MDDDDPRAPGRPESGFSKLVASKAARRLRARRSGAAGVWSGLGMTGMIGWSIALPTVSGALLGLWLDRRDPGGRSWTLALLAAGLCLGCASAWRWVSRQQRAMREENESDD